MKAKNSHVQMQPGSRLNQSLREMAEVTDAQKEQPQSSLLRHPLRIISSTEDNGS